jgi:hypothetical protein
VQPREHGARIAVRLRHQQRVQIVPFGVLDRKEARQQTADREEQQDGACDEGDPFQIRRYRTRDGEGAA